jgi:RNA polymerase sigma factor (sigma-70 family)
MARRHDALSDDALVALVRSGESAPYGELWSRHAAAGRAVARGFTTLDEDDVVAEAFTRVLAGIRRGGGPSMGFRPYLLTSVRNVAREWGSRNPSSEALPDRDIADPQATALEDAAIETLESGVAVEAFRRLPSRWQEALWFSEVDELKPRELAPLLGLSANAASALVLRARRAFRDAWIAGQLRRADSPECREVLRQLGSHTRGGLAARQAERVEAHLLTCDSCTLAWTEARDVASRLALVLLPLVGGAVGAAAYSVWVRSGGPAATTASLVVGGGAGVAGGAGGAGGAGSSGAGGAGSASAAVRMPRVGRSARTVVGGAIGAAVLVAATVVVAVAMSVGGAEAPTTVDAAPLSPPAAAPPASADPSDDAAEVKPTVPPPSLPHREDSSDPRSGAPARGDDPRPGTDSSVRPALPPTGKPDPWLPPTSPPPSSPPPSSPPPTSPPPTTPPPSSPPPTTPPPTKPELPAPSMLVDTSLGSFFYPLVEGDDAEPGATVELLDESGIVRATTVADGSGAWTVDDLSSNECAVDADSYLQPGSHTLSVRQTVDGETSPGSDPVALTVGAAPVIVSPTSNETVDNSGFLLSVSGEPGFDVQRIKLPDAAPCRPTPMPLDASGSYESTFTLPDTGDVTIGARYLDTATGRHGPAVFVAFRAE